MHYGACSNPQTPNVVFMVLLLPSRCPVWAIRAEFGRSKRLKDTGAEVVPEVPLSSPVWQIYASLMKS